MRALGLGKTGFLPLLVALCASVSACFWTANVSAVELRLPELTAPVMDEVGLLSNAEVGSLSQVLREMNAQGKAQLTVYVTSSLQDHAIEEYGIKLAEKWKLGGKDTDKGLILLIAPNERKMRLEVGYGLEGEIPDVIAKRILDDVVRPYFKRGQYYEGVTGAIVEIAKRTEINPSAALEAKRAARQMSYKEGPGLWYLVLFIFLLGGGFGSFFFVLLGGAGGYAVGYLTGLFPAVLGLFIGGVLGRIAAGVVSALGLGPRGPAQDWAMRTNRSPWSGRRGGLGGFGGFGGGGGGFGGGGWGGGGGGFGGGGGSSSW